MAGCSSRSVAEVFEEHGAAARAKLARVDEVAATMQAVPPLAGATVQAPPSLQVHVGALAARADTAVVYLEDITRRGELGMVFARLGGTRTVPECASMLDHRTFPWDPREPRGWDAAISGPQVESRLAFCRRLSHVLVLRAVELTLPSAPRLERGPTPVPSSAPPAAPPPTAPPPAGAEAGAGGVSDYSCRMTGARCVFDGGFIGLEAHLFSLDPVRHLGGFPVEAESRDAVELRVQYGGTPALLELDLEAALREALRAAIKAHLPGATAL